MIPKRFTLVNRSWLVRVITAKQMQGHLDKHYPKEGRADEMFGFCDPERARILINKDKHTSDDSLFHTYCHELTHAIKFANGEMDHCEEEVDRLGGFLAQIIKSAK